MRRAKNAESSTYRGKSLREFLESRGWKRISRYRFERNGVEDFDVNAVEDERDSDCIELLAAIDEVLASGGAGGDARGCINICQPERTPMDARHATPPATKRAWELLSDSEIELMISLYPEPVVMPRCVSHSLKCRFAVARRRICKDRRAA